MILPSGMVQIGILGSGIFHTLSLAFLQPPFTILFLISLSDCKIALQSLLLSFSSKCAWDISGHFMPTSSIMVLAVILICTKDKYSNSKTASCSHPRFHCCNIGARIFPWHISRCAQEHCILKIQ